MKYFNNNTDGDDTYDDKIRNKISDIRMILGRLRNTVTNNDRKKVRRELYEIEKKKNLSDKKKEEIYDHVVELVNTSIKKKNISIMTQTTKHDLGYYGIRNI